MPGLVLSNVMESAFCSQRRRDELPPQRFFSGGLFASGGEELEEPAVEAVAGSRRAADGRTRGAASDRRYRFARFSHLSQNSNPSVSSFQSLAGIRPTMESGSEGSLFEYRLEVSVSSQKEPSRPLPKSIPVVGSRRGAADEPAADDEDSPPEFLTAQPQSALRLGKTTFSSSFLSNDDLASRAFGVVASSWGRAYRASL